MDWARYLTRGLHVPYNVYNASTITSSVDVIQNLKCKGWILVEIDTSDFEPMHQWEHLFNDAFSSSLEQKASQGLYRTEKGVSVGWRNDDEREFFETRVTSVNGVTPSFDQTVALYDSIITSIYKGLNKIATNVLKRVSEDLGLDSSFMLGLTDIQYNGAIPSCESLRKVKPDTTNDDGSEYSSSLLRICKYVNNTSDTSKISSLAFGAHTDSSFLTIALCSSSSGLEILDMETNTWICPEEFEYVKTHKNTAIVFIGEFLQVLTKDRYKATIHRVKYNSLHPTRISCPYLIRGRHEYIININNEKYIHPGGDEALSSDKIPDLNGLSIKMMHKLLDLKRQKCFRENEKNENKNWVLSAFPRDNIPE